MTSSFNPSTLEVEAGQSLCGDRLCFCWVAVRSTYRNFFSPTFSLIFFLQSWRPNPGPCACMLGQLFAAVSGGFCACSFCLIFVSSCVVNCVCVPACECGHMHLCTVCGCHRTTQALADIFHLFGAASVCAAPARALPWAFLGFS